MLTLKDILKVNKLLEQTGGREGLIKHPIHKHSNSQRKTVTLNLKYKETSDGDIALYNE